MEKILNVNRFQAILLGLLLSVALSPASNAQDFRLATSAGVSHTGYTAREGNAGTMYADLSVAPDWRFAQHWGALAELSLGAGIAGSGSGHGLETVQAKLVLAPYWEQQFGQWYLDVMAGAFVRARQPFYGPTPVRFGPTVTAGPAVGLRAGYFVSDKVDVFATIRGERTLYDPLSATAPLYLTDYRAGNLVLAFGLRFNL